MNPVIQLIKTQLDENLTDFELVDGGQQRTVGDLIESKVSEILKNTSILKTFFPHLLLLVYL